MPLAFPEIKNFAGLYKQANSFSVPDGALEQAMNFVLTKDGILSKTRGYYDFYEPTGQTINNIHLYQNKLIAVFNNQLAYFTETGSDPNKTGVKNALTGATVAVTGTRVSRAAESNKNLYVTSDNGVIKLEAYDGKVYKAGVPPALDLRARFTKANGPIAGETQVAWRLVFGRRDSNDNLLLGAPSDIIVLTNAKVTGSSWVRASNVVTVTTTTAHNLATGMQITVSNSAGGSPEVDNGAYTVTVTGATTFTFPHTGTDDGSGNTLDYTATRATLLEFSVPSEIDSATDEWFAQIYRTTQTSGSSVSPTANFKLVDELTLTSAQIAAGVIFYEDDTDDILLGPELYTNPNSREGELQANDRPPLCQDITLFKNHMIYANCQTRHLLDLQVVDPSSISGTDYVEVKVGETTRRYVARTGVANQTVKATSVADDGGGDLQITYAAHGLENGDKVYVTNVTGGSLASGNYFVVNKATDTFEISLTSGGAAVVFNSETSLDFQGVTNGTYPIFFLDNASSSAAVKLRNTAQGLVKAINRDTSSLVYARYTSGISDIPGKIKLLAKGFTDAIYLRASTSTVGGAFSPALPDSFASGTQVFSRNDQLPSTWFAAKIGEPEAVPLLNQFPTGARNQNLLRAVALRDVMLMIKADGVYRVTGDSVSNFSVTPLDTTVSCIAASTVKKINDEVIFLSNQGWVRCTDSSVQIISRDIEDPVTPILGDDTISDLSSAVAYESEHLYLVSTRLPDSDETSTTYIYNPFSGAWTESDVLLKQGVVGPKDTLYLIATSGKILKERKLQTKIDYCGQNYDITVTSVAVDLMSATISSPFAAPKKGWVIVKDDLFSRINAVSNNGGASYTVTFTAQTNLEAEDELALYASYKSTAKLAPFHGGLVGKMKQFCELQIHLRQSAVSEFSIWFTNTYFDASDFTTWRARDATVPGYGIGPWGATPWGDTVSINLQYGTLPMPPVRVAIPALVQRGTYIQPVVEHEQAGEPISIQAMTFVVRPYGHRVAA